MIFPAARLYALDRDRDESGVSGTGRVAYAFNLPTGVLVVWDAEKVTLDWRPDMAAVVAIHSHNGATRITPLDDPADWDRATVLLREVIHRALDTYVEASRILLP